MDYNQLRIGKVNCGDQESKSLVYYFGYGGVGTGVMHKWFNGFGVFFDAKINPNNKIGSKVFNNDIIDGTRTILDFSGPRGIESINVLRRALNETEKALRKRKYLNAGQSLHGKFFEDEL